MRVCKSLISAVLAVLLCSCSFTLANKPKDKLPVKDGTESVDTVASEAEDSGLSIESDTAGVILDYFSEIAFGSEYGQSSNRLCRWETEILYTVKGDPGDSDVELVEILAEKLNTISGFPGIREARFGEEPNFEIMFITRDEIVEEFADATDACAGMSEYRWYTESCEIFRARAAIDREETDERASTTCEEILQSLGLAMDSYSHKDSVFYQGKCVYQRPSELDWTLVELLYHPDLNTGMTKKDAITAAAGVLKW